MKTLLLLLLFLLTCTTDTSSPPSSPLDLSVFPDNITTPYGTHLFTAGFLPLNVMNYC